MTESSAETRCSNPGCEVATTGICAEGHQPLEACPSYGHELAEEIANVEDSIDDNAEHEITEHNTSLPRGEALSTAEIDIFLRWRPATRVAIIGERDSGKTTLICSIYSQFVQGPFAGYIFAGSQTLIAFEKKSHLSRVDSGGRRPDTAHTSLSDGLNFFHIATVDKRRCDERSDLMFSDRAGEMYRRARDNSNNVSELSEIMHSDRVVLLLDGGRIANAALRAGAIQSVRQLLRAFIDGGALGLTSIVQIVTTKTDLLASHAEKQEIDAQLKIFRQNLVNDFEDRLAELSFWEIAARDPKGRFEPAYGVDKLFTDWATPRIKTVPRSTLDISLSSEFDRLLLRTPMEILP